MVILSHPTGNANAREAARALNEANLLEELWTSVYWRPDRAINRALPSFLRRELGRRAFPHVPHRRIRCNLWPEVGRLMADRLGLKRLVSHEVGVLSVDAVYHSLDRRVARRLQRRPQVLGVYAYEDGALASFKSAEKLGIKRIYELPIGYWKWYRELLAEENERQPEWKSTLQGHIDSSYKRNRKDEELARASCIIVPSRFVRNTLAKACTLTAPIRIVPYGAPAPVKRSKSAEQRGRKLKVIFVGSLSQRKGISYLLRAIELMGKGVELTLIGRRVGESNTLVRALQVHRWIPSLPHAEVLEEMRRHDVMVFPSLFEGFGLVILEALSCGVPVITTANGGAPDVLTEGEDGFIVPIRAPEAIAEKLEMLAQDRDRLAAMADAAVQKAIVHSWDRYRALMAQTVRQELAHEATSDAFENPRLAACNS